MVKAHKVKRKMLGLIEPRSPKSLQSLFFYDSLEKKHIGHFHLTLVKRKYFMSGFQTLLAELSVGQNRQRVGALTWPACFNHLMLFGPFYNVETSWRLHNLV